MQRRIPLFFFLSILPLFISYQPSIARLGIDYGPRLIGVSHSDSLGQVRPLATLPNHGNLTAISHDILRLATRYGATELVVGIPVDIDGKLRHNCHNFNGQLCLNFSRVLCTVCSSSEQSQASLFKVLLFDERYTTREAKIRLAAENSKASLDAMSACCLLERYLEDKGEGSLPAVPHPYGIPESSATFDYELVREHIRKRYFSEYRQTESDGKKKWSKEETMFFLKTGQQLKRKVNVAPRSLRDVVPVKRKSIDDKKASDPSPLSAEEEEYLQTIHAQRRKKGTLKRLHRPTNTDSP